MAVGDFDIVFITLNDVNLITALFSYRGVIGQCFADARGVRPQYKLGWEALRCLCPVEPITRWRRGYDRASDRFKRICHGKSRNHSLSPIV